MTRMLLVPFKLLNHLHHHHRRSFSLRPPHHSLLLLPSSIQAAPSPSRRFSPFMEVFSAVASKGSTHQHAVAIRVGQISYTYHQLLLSAFSISKLLSHNTSTPGQNDSTTAHLGGARIGIEAKPSAEFVSAVLGTWFSGGVAVPLALSYPEAELLHVINDSDVSVILSTEKNNEPLQNAAAKGDAHFSVIPDVSIVSETGDVDGMDMLAETTLRNTNRAVEDPALIIYTSGTTGKPKGVVHTHRSIAAQVQTLSEAWEYTPTDQFLHCLPLHHVHGLFNALLAPLYAGSMVEFLPKFSVRGIWQRWRESYPLDGTHVPDAITVFTGVPTMYTRLLQGYEAMDTDLQAASASASSKLRLMMCGSSALPYPVMQQWETITGHRLLERYGMTEFVMALSNPLKGLRKGGTVGKPFPGVETKILADDSGSDAGIGELCVRSLSLFKEYWKLPQVTEQSFVDGGFFKTGDAVKVDEDGYYIILGRTSADIMKVGGYKLSALEIEAVLLEVSHVDSGPKTLSFFISASFVLQ
uniref:AMP-dependent synthetase/ligase domain-containing protein n=1 Tax=Kalanchoe fedtschenkoi TaxID=63787 RepID=A0A7N0SWL4_KALFE